MGHTTLKSLINFKESVFDEMDSYKITFAIDPSNEVFNGHFPKQPILPGVIMVDIVRKSLEKIEGRSLLLYTAGNIKFLKLLIPNNKDYHLILKIKDTEGKSTINAQIIQDDVVYFKQNASYIGK